MAYYVTPSPALFRKIGVIQMAVDDNNRSPEYRDKLAKEARINALLAERKGYEARGLDDRVAGVNAELKSLDYREDASADKGDARNAPNAETRGGK